MNQQNPRRSFQFSLRALFALVTVAVLGVVIVPRLANRYAAWKRERELNQLIELIVTTVKPATGNWTDDGN